MDIATYIQEEYIMQTAAVVMFAAILLPYMAVEISLKFTNSMDELTERKLKKIMRAAYENFNEIDPATAKQNTMSYVKHIYKNKLVNEKYDLIRRYDEKKFSNLA